MKDQTIPAGDVLMYENPGDELFFGEVYRQILQEAWLPESAEVWSRLGKSRRGRRPTQRGMGAQSPTLSQAAVRRCFSLCSDNWRRLPGSYPADHPCAGIPGKEFWFQQKLDRSVICSYYDLYMRYCLYFCLKISCPPEDIVCWEWDPDSSKETIHGYWAGIYVLGGFPPYEWSVDDPNFWIQALITSIPSNGITTREDKCGIANITVTDHCGRTVEGVVTTPDVPWPYIPPIWPLSNEQEIGQDDEQNVFIEEGVPPFKWEVSGEGFTLAHEETQDRENILYSSDTACGSANISVTDCLYKYAIGHLRCTAGQWVFKSEDQCELPGHFTRQISGNEHERIYGNKMMYQQFGGVCSHSGGEQTCDTPFVCNKTGYRCGDHVDCVPNGCFPCITGQGIPSQFGCHDIAPGNYYVDCVKVLEYYEWEC